MTPTRVLVLVLSIVSVTPLFGDDGKLQAVRESVREPNSSSTDKQGQTNSGDDGSGNSTGDRIFGEIVAAPFMVPHILLNDDFIVNGYFLPYPFAHEQRGYMLMDPKDSYHFHRESAEPDYFADASAWMLRLGIEESNDFDGLNRINGQLLLDTTYRFGLLGSWSYLHERLERSRTDDLQLGDLNLVYRFAQNKWVQVRSGVGVRFMIDRDDTHYGFNFNYSGDLFPVEPLVLSTSFDVGSLGHAFVLHARQTAGLSFRGWEAYLGYDFLRIGSTNLQGPVIGLRYWY